MKQRLVKSTANVVFAALITVISGLVVSGSAFAAPNTATGSIAGTSSDLTDSAAFNLLTRQLALYKTAYLTDGTELTDGARLPAGTVVHFLIYVNNDTSVQVNDVRMGDTLNAIFAYANDNSVVFGTTAACTNGGANDGLCNQAERDALYAAAVGGTATTDAAAAGDVVGVTAGDVVSVGKQDAGNDQLDVSANTAWAVLIPVTMQ